MSIARPLVTEQEHRAGFSDYRAVTRAIGAVLFLLQPIVGLVAIGSGLVLLKQRTIRPRVYVPVAIAVLVLAIVLGAGHHWIEPARSLAEAARASDGALPARLDSIASTARSQWASWIVRQAPFSAAVGLVVGASWAALRSRRRASWRETPADQEPASERSIERALDRLADWPQKPTTSDPIVDIRDLALSLGVTAYGPPKPYTLTYREVLSHCYVDAPTRVGKTTFLVEVAGSLLSDPEVARRRCPLAFVTMKPDPEVTTALGLLANDAGRRLHHVTHDGTGSLTNSTYSALAGKTAHQIASMVMEVEAHSAEGGFTEPHHRATGERMLRLSARALMELADKKPDVWIVDFTHLTRLTYPSAMDDQADLYSPGLAADWSRFKTEIAQDRDLSRSIGGIRQRLARAAEGGANGVLSGTGTAALNLVEALDAGDVVLFDLDAAADATAARMVGNLAIRDFVMSIAKLGQSGWNLARNDYDEPILGRDDEPIHRRLGMFIVDEFPALGGDGLRDVFERSAGYGAGVILSTQQAGSLDEAGPTFRELVLTNANVKVLFTQTVNAEPFADLFGTKKVYDESVQTFEDGALVAGSNVYKSGQGNLRQVDAYVIHPNLLRHLPPGTAVVGVRTRAGTPDVVRIRNLVRPTYRGQTWSPPADQQASSGEPVTADDADTSDDVPAPTGTEPRQQDGRRDRRVQPPQNISRRTEPPPLPDTTSGRGRRAPRGAVSLRTSPSSPTRTARSAAPAWTDEDDDEWPAPDHGPTDQEPTDAESMAEWDERDSEAWPPPAAGGRPAVR